MGRQWLHSKKEVTANRRAQITSKLVREIMVAAKMGVPDPAMNPRLALAVEAARALPFPFTLTARAENFLHGIRDMDDTLKRLQAFEKAGADARPEEFKRYGSARRLYNFNIDHADAY